MPGTLLHPSFRRLSLFADGDLTATAARKVAAHLERCARCRATLGNICLADDAARSLPASPLPAEVRERVLARHAAGETVILPLADAPARAAPPRGWRIAAVAAVVLALVGTPFVLPRGDLEASRSELVFTPAAPRPGAVVRVAYRSGSLLAGEQRLRLRARYLRHDDPPVRISRQSTVAELRRGNDGVFHGTIRLPDGVVFAAFAVEDLRGERVDSNRRRLWELLVHGPDGHPRREALAQRQFDHLDSNWELGQQNAAQVTELYPDRVDAWFQRYMVDRTSFTGAARDSIEREARARMAEFDRRFRARNNLHPTDEVGIITRFAGELDDSTRYRYWRERLLRTAPNSLWGVQERFFDLAMLSERDPRRALAGFDSIWNQADRRYASLFLISGFEMAARTGDMEAVRRWSGRRDPRDPPFPSLSAQYPALRDEEMATLRAWIRSLEQVDDSVRPLDRTVAEERRARAEQASRALAELGELLLASGRRGSALDTLALATRTGWDAALFRRVAGLRLEVGDTAGAAVPLALAAADPLAGAALADSARLLLGSRFDAAAWNAQLAGARREMAERVLANATRKELPDRIRLRDADGRTRTLREIAGGRPTFIAFWHRYCPYSVAQIAQLQQVAASFQARGYAVVTLTEPATPEFRRYMREQRLTLPIYGDAWKDLEKALDPWGTPHYYVIDAAGNLRFGPLHDLLAVPAQMAVIAE